MASDRLRDLIKPLLQATQTGKIVWQPTAKEGAFRVALGDGLVRIEYRSGDYSIYLVSRKGQTIDELNSYTSTNREIYKLLDDLYKSARLSAYDADAVIDSMLKDIEEGRTRELPPENEKSNVPF